MNRYFRRHRPRRGAAFRSCAVLLLGCAAVLACQPPAAAVVIRRQEWPLDARHFDSGAVWRLSRGNGVTVAVVDSGVDAGHPDLVGQVLPGTGFTGLKGDRGRTDASGDSHGTAIAAIIAGTGRADGGSGMIGLAPRARILPVRVSVGGRVEPIALAEGIRYAADHHAQVINISLTTDDPDPVLRRAVDYAMSKDCVVVAAAGNEGGNGDPALYPAAFPGVVDVSGVDAAGRFWPMSESGPRTALAAPAAGIYSADDTGQYVDAAGTSYASAYVSAAAALVRSAAPRLTAAQTVERLVATADPPAGHGGQVGDEYGYGVLDPLAALRSRAPLASVTANPLLSARPVRASASWRTPGIVGAAVALALAVGAGVLVLARRRRRRRGPGPLPPRKGPPPAGRARRPSGRSRPARPGTGPGRERTGRSAG